MQSTCRLMGFTSGRCSRISLAPHERAIFKKDRTCGSEVKLAKFIRSGLDVLFVGLNAPSQSNSNGHWFSGAGSRFFKLLAKSQLIVPKIAKECADETVFGTTEINYAGSRLGVIDLVEDLVMTDSRHVRFTQHHVDSLLDLIRELDPHFVCIIHSKVTRGLNARGNLKSQLNYWPRGAGLRGSNAEFFVNYFPTGNAIPDESKLAIFQSLRGRVSTRRGTSTS